MRILSLQCETVTGAVERNYERAFKLLEAAGTLYEADVILLPECFAACFSSPCPAEWADTAETVPGKTTARFSDYSRRYQALIAFGLIRKNPAGPGCYNSIILMDQGEIVGIYDKTHLFTTHGEKDKWQNESAGFIRGEKLGLFDTRFGRVGVMTCHDGGYPELPRALVLGGAQVIFWHVGASDVREWAKLHAFWNVVPLAVSNITQRNTAGQRHCGGSLIVNYDGKVLDVAEYSEAFVYGEVDLDAAQRFREKGVGGWANVYRVRRPDLYGALCKPSTEPPPR